MVQSGTLFEYLAAFVTVVLGLALADLLISLHRLIRARKRVVWRPLPLLLALFVFLTLLTGFFELWTMTRWERASFYDLVWQMLLCIPLFLVVCAALPDDVPAAGLDLGDFYLSERLYIAVLMALALALDVVDEMARSWANHGLAALGHPDFLFDFLSWNLVAIAALAVIGFSARLWTHWLALTVLFASAHVGYSVWYIRGASALVAAPPLH
jgi:hypothetical protein